MRSFILRAIAALLALALSAGGVAAQGKKKKKRAAAKTTAAKTGSSSSKTPTQPYTGDPIPPPQAPERGDGVRRITPLEARAAQQKGNAIIVDVRNDEVYQVSRIKDAILIPVNEVANRLNKFPRNKLIITYCS